MKAMLLASMLAMISTANAADITTHYNEGSWGVFVIGEIKSDDDKKFRRMVEPLPDANVIVWLNSPGGDIIAGINIGEEIHARRFGTVVVDSCASVCGLMWLAGTPRGVGEDAHIGFHAAYYSLNGQVSPEANAWAGAYLNRLGFSYATIEFLTHTSPDSMQWVTADLAARYGIRALVFPKREKPESARTDWWLYIQSIVMGILAPVVMGILPLGILIKTRRKKVRERKKVMLTTFDKVLLSVTAVPVTALAAIFLMVAAMNGAFEALHWDRILLAAAGGFGMTFIPAHPLLKRIYKKVKGEKVIWSDAGIAAKQNIELTTFDKVLLGLLAVPVTGIVGVMVLICFVAWS